MDNIEKRRRLIKLMDDNKLTSSDVAKILNRTIERVYCWRSNHNMPDHMLQLLEMKIKEMEPVYGKS